VQTNESIRFGAARVALRALWTVCVLAPESFVPTRVRFGGEETDVDEQQAAAHIATMPGAIELDGEVAGAGILRVQVVQRAGGPRDRRSGPEAPRALDFLRAESSSSSLVLATGRAYKVSPAVADHLAANFFLSPGVSGGGGPPDDLWATQLKLPPSWLEGVELAAWPEYRKWHQHAAVVGRRGMECRQPGHRVTSPSTSAPRRPT